MLQYEFPDKYKDWIEGHLQALGHSLERPEELAKAVKWTSDNYINNQAQDTPWSSRDAQVAYLCYYFPLNYVRTLKVIDEAKRLNFFRGSNLLIDYGCGPGTTTKALLDQEPFFQKAIGIDKAPILKPYYATADNLQYRSDRPPLLEPFTLALSYVLNELVHAPDWFYKAESLLIMEPSSHQESQNLQEYRQHLIDKGFFIWGPCLHQKTCPLIEHKKDWCHDRAYWTQPSWFKELSECLPMDNQSLAFSYILAKKTPPPKAEGLRLIGDARVEKGKTKWLVCDPEARRFISALHRNGEPPRLYRGDIYRDPVDTLKGNEWRLPSSKG